jgi:hypothetical protein
VYEGEKQEPKEGADARDEESDGEGSDEDNEYSEVSDH